MGCSIIGKFSAWYFCNKYITQYASPKMLILKSYYKINQESISFLKKVYVISLFNLSNHET